MMPSGAGSGTNQAHLLRRISTMFQDRPKTKLDGITVLQSPIEFDEESPHKRKNVYKQVLDSIAMQLVNTVVNVFLLFGDDIRLSFFPKTIDTGFTILTCVVLFFALLDIALQVGADPKFLFSFLFFVDLISTATVSFIWIPTLDQYQISSAIRASRAARLGSRTALMTLRSHFERLTSKNTTVMTTPAEDTQQSQLGLDLSAMISKKTIVVVLSMVIVLPFVYMFGTTSVSTFDNDGQLNLLEMMYRSTNSSAVVTEAIADRFVTSSKVNAPLIYIRVNGIDFTPPSLYVDPSTLRSTEIEMHTSSSGRSVAMFNITSSEQTQYRASLIETLFVICTLALVSTSFTSDITQMVVEPIDHLVNRVKKIAEDPLNPALFTVEEQKAAPSKQRTRLGRQTSLMKPSSPPPSPAGAAATTASTSSTQTETSAPRSASEQHPPPDAAAAAAANPADGKSKSQIEIRALDQSISKIVQLLALGFGEAGREVIRKNLKTTAALDAVMPGQKVHAIFGFCDIRNFTDICECLQQDVMRFTNHIAKIVHEHVQFYGGHCNKNIGDAFLLVWKLPDLGSREDKHLEFNLKSLNMLGWEQLADNALMAFLKITADINRSAELAAYRDNPAIRARFGDGFRIRMGFGLHVGWAIEGAIGSRFKIDASYLSPNVNLTARLESATKQFGVQILLSEQFVQLLSTAAQFKIRKIDNVVVKGASEPVGLHTFDITDHSPLPRPPTQAHRPTTEAAVSVVFRSDSDVSGLQRGLPKLLIPSWRKAFALYESGDWAACRDEIDACLKLLPGDGPSLALRHFMESHSYTAPQGWAGYRALDSK
ncbi:hypothetical protein PBRA_004456 [Plasmodiophora brassicae]|nr:hypothetical protein PBRA_004456 [Plasmodiophora brassicae]